MLHIVNKSPFERSALDSCLRLAKKGSAILLFEDGVFAALKGCATTDKMSAAARDFNVFVLGPDLSARGFEQDQVVDGVTVVDYGGFVDLTVDRGPVQSWL